LCLKLLLLHLLLLMLLRYRIQLRIPHCDLIVLWMAAQSQPQTLLLLLEELSIRERAW
jgi:hypothetical protein